MTLYEENSKSIDAQIALWETIRKEQVLSYYGRKEGLKNFGLQPLPMLAVSEYRAKEAIQQVLLLKSLKNSPFGREEWGLTDTSAELTHTAPRNAFKKDPYVVTVLFDHDPDNTFPYTNWNALYLQDDNDMWYKTPGKVDINGLYYEDKNGDKNYFQLFATEAETYGKGEGWTVKYKHETISTSAPVSSSQEPLFDSLQGSAKGSVSSSGDAVSQPKTPRRQEGEEGRASSTTETPPAVRRRRRGEQGEPSTTRSKRRRKEKSDFELSAREVGRGHHLVPRSGLTRLERLEAEARDPPIIIVKGGANQLKCWRYRCKKGLVPCLTMSTVFKYSQISTSTVPRNHRMLVAFKSNNQRQLFLDTVSIPKGATYSLGNLAAL